MAYTNAELKHKVYQAKRAGKKRLILGIPDEQADFLRDLGFEVKPYLYRIKTKAWSSADEVTGILKELHFLRKQGVAQCVKPLDAKKRKKLDAHNVEYKVAKYLIVLNKPKAEISTT